MDLQSDHLIIYPQTAQRIQRYQLAQSVADLEVVLPKEVRISSVILVEETENGNVLLPYTVKTNRRKSHLKVKVTRGNQNWEGLLIEHNPKLVSLQVGETIVHLRNYDTIEEPGDFREGFRIIVKNSALSNVKGSTLIITYLLGALAWEGNYTVVLDVENSVITMMRLNALITASLLVPISSTKTTLVAGQIRTISKGYPTSGEMLSRAVIAPIEAVPTSLGEYTEYSLDGLNLEETIPVDIFTLTEIASEKIYLNTLGSPRVDYGYHLEAPRFLPGGDVIVYSTGHGLLGSHIGSTHIEETRAQEDLDLVIGSTSSVRVNTAIVEEPPDVTITSEIDNQNETDITIYLRYYIADNNVVDVDCDVDWERKLNMIQFPLVITANMKMTFSCRLKVVKEE